MLAQDMLCHADADLITYNWMDTQRHPFPDFAINRRCRSVEDLLAYRDKHSVDLDRYMLMPKPKNAVQVPSEPGYYAMVSISCKKDPSVINSFASMGLPVVSYIPMAEMPHLFPKLIGSVIVVRDGHSIRMQFQR
jgi:hypothetical protein